MISPAVKRSIAAGCKVQFSFRYKLIVIIQVLFKSPAVMSRSPPAVLFEIDDCDNLVLTSPYKYMQVSVSVSVTSYR